VKALDARTQQLQAALEEKSREVETLRGELTATRARLDALEAMVREMAGKR